MTDIDQVLPTLLTVTTAFSKRLPTQRICDELAHLEPTLKFGEIAQTQPFRLIAFRALVRDYPGRDMASLWLHSYDCEVDVVEVDPFVPNLPLLEPPSVSTGVSDR